MKVKGLKPLKKPPRMTKADREFELLWNLRLFPFIIKNYDVIFKKNGSNDLVQ